MRRLYWERGINGVVESAGTAAWHAGEPADSRSIVVAQESGINLTAHRARQVCADDFQRFDVIYAMDQENEIELRAMANHASRHKIRRLRIAAQDVTGSDVPDPYSGDLDDFRRVLHIVTTCCQRVAGETQP